MFFNKSKRAMSVIVTTLIIIVLVLVAIGTTWVIIKEVLSEGTDQIATSQLSIFSRMGLKIVTAEVNEDTERLVVKVKRNQGGGNLSGIVFVVGNETFSKSVKRETDLKELEQRTFSFFLSEFGLNLDTAEEISIAPITTSDGEEIIGAIMDTSQIKQVTLADQTPDCSENSDCGTDSWVPEIKYCSENNVLQEWIEHLCESELCSIQSNLIIKEDCSAQNKICFAEECIEELPSCSENSDCGTDSLVTGTEYCYEEEIWQIWKEYRCESDICIENISIQFQNDCSSQNKECFVGECFTPLECFEHSDCNVGEMCKENMCVPEYPLYSGTIYSIWPIGGGEYLDDLLLPKSEINYLNYFIGFTGDESQCLKIIQHVYPDSPEYNSYIKLNSTSKIQAGDTYKIWETLWGCDN